MYIVQDHGHRTQTRTHKWTRELAAVMYMNSATYTNIDTDAHTAADTNMATNDIFELIYRSTTYVTGLTELHIDTFYIEVCSLVFFVA